MVGDKRCKQLKFKSHGSSNIIRSKSLCSTYARYNNGSLFGKWLDLSDYSDKDEFLEACRKLHKDEQDPEYMFQDYENIPEA